MNSLLDSGNNTLPDGPAGRGELCGVFGGDLGGVFAFGGSGKGNCALGGDRGAGPAPLNLLTHFPLGGPCCQQNSPTVASLVHLGPSPSFPVLQIHCIFITSIYFFFYNFTKL